MITSIHITTLYCLCGYQLYSSHFYIVDTFSNVTHAGGARGICFATPLRSMFRLRLCGARGSNVQRLLKNTYS